MSTGYNIIPLDLLLTDEEDVVRLNKVDLPLPNPRSPSRAPMVEDFRAVLDDWTACDYGESVRGKELEICVTARDGYDSTFIFINDYETDQTDEERTDRLRFNNGSAELLVALTERLARLCGPFLLIESGGGVVVVGPGTSPDVEWALML